MPVRALFVVISLSLGGCGLKGDLYLPEEDAEVVTSEPTEAGPNEAIEEELKRQSDTDDSTPP